MKLNTNKITIAEARGERANDSGLYRRRKIIFSALKCNQWKKNSCKTRNVTTPAYNLCVSNIFTAGSRFFFWLHLPWSAFSFAKNLVLLNTCMVDIASDARR